MSANFDYIRKKRTASAIINTAVIAICCFAIFYGVFTLLSKFGAIVIDQFIVLSVCAGAGIIAAGVTAFLVFKTRHEIAKELDEAHSLNERIETMITYEGDDGYIARLQREDAEAVLRRIGDNRSFFRQFGASIISAIIATSILLGAMLIPAPSSDDGSVEPPVYVEPFQLAVWQENKLNELIEKVNISKIDESFKSTTVTELTRLLGVLKSTDTKDKMLSEVISSIVLIDAAAEVTAGYKLIAVALFSAEPITDSETGDEVDPLTYIEIKNLAKYIIKLNAIDFGQDIKKIREYFKEDSIITDSDEGGSRSTEQKVITVKDKILSFKAELERVLDDEDIPEGDAMKKHLIDFANEIGKLSEITNENERQSLLDIEFDKLSDNISTVLVAQYENKSVRDTVINTLMLVFEIDKSMLPKLLGDTVPTLSDGGSDSGGSDESGSVSGGYGEGNELFGSNDTIYDPFGKDGAGHILYGEVLDDYYKKIVELLSDESISEQTRQAMAEYFKRLSDGTKNKN